jgi:hypothetical protein
MTVIIVVAATMVEGISLSFDGRTFASLGLLISPFPLAYSGYSQSVIASTWSFEGKIS